MNQLQALHTTMDFTVSGLRLEAKVWGSQDGIPTIGLHGWLDNANTFDRLAPLLPELRLIALDFAGHGHSDHRPEGVYYQSTYNVQEVLAIANQLGWEKFNLIGHSMGAAIASEIAGLFPERVNHVIEIDGFLATGGVSTEDRVAQSRQAVERALNPHHSKAKVFENVTHMAQRVTEATDQTIEAARVLVERGHKKVEDGVTWRTDPRIRHPTPMRYTREQIDLIVKASTSPALLIVAEQGDKWYQGEIGQTASLHPNLSIVRMDGPHHLHLEPAHVAGVAKVIRTFLSLGNR